MNTELGYYKLATSLLIQNINTFYGDKGALGTDLKTSKNMTYKQEYTAFRDIIIKIINNGLDKGYLSQDNLSDRIKKQGWKNLEEVGELAKAMLQKNKDQIIDGIGDIFVTIVGVMFLESLNHKDISDFNSKSRGHKLLDKLSYLIDDALLVCPEITKEYTLLSILELVLNEISSRTGKMIDNVFVKD